MKLSDVFESGSVRFHARNADAMGAIEAHHELFDKFDDFMLGDWGNSWEFANLALSEGATDEQLTAMYGEAINQLTHAQFREWVAEGKIHFDKHMAWPAAGTYVTDG